MTLASTWPAHPHALRPAFRKHSPTRFLYLLIPSPTSSSCSSTTPINRCMPLLHNRKADRTHATTITTPPRRSRPSSSHSVGQLPPPPPPPPSCASRTTQFFPPSAFGAGNGWKKKETFPFFLPSATGAGSYSPTVGGLQGQSRDQRLKGMEGQQSRLQFNLQHPDALLAQKAMRISVDEDSFDEDFFEEDSWRADS